VATRENVTAAELPTVMLQGSTGGGNITNMVQTVTIRESICSSYITGDVVALDNQNVISNFGLTGGSPCMISFTAPSTMGGGGSYSIDMYVVDIKAESSPENMELKIYTISLCSSEYFTDRATLTSKSSDQGQTGCMLAQQIWGECGFKTALLQPTQDAPLRDGNQPFHVDLAKPFTAIGQIRDIQFYPGFPTGNVLLFRNYRGVNHVPLQYIYQTASPTLTFIQRHTWGIRWDHMFGAENSWLAMIDVKQYTRAQMWDPTMFKTQTKRMFDHSAGKLGGNLFQGLLGAGQNMAASNSDRTSAAIDFSNMIDKARYYAVCTKAQPQYLVRVPIQSGINITAGVGVGLDLLPISASGSNPNSGTFLVTDLVHEIHRDLRNVKGTTVLQCLKKTGACSV
jgi:hypothetical protein